MKSSQKEVPPESSGRFEDIEEILGSAIQELGFSRGDPDGFEVRQLFGDGSDRRFYRLRNGSSRFVLLMASRRKETGVDENDSYFLIGKHLFRCGIPVPRIVRAEPHRGWFLLEDVGDNHLQRQARRGLVHLNGLYKRVTKLLFQIHRKAPAGFEVSFCFDTPLYDPQFVYERELEYFREAFLVKCLGLEIAEADLREDFMHLAEEAGVTHTDTVIHRDFQSRNIMVHRGGLRVLDFQGMRFGPPAYDLASLLIDPYVSVPRALQEGLVGLYWASAREFLGCSHAQFERSYTAVRLCRNLQVLGAYGFLGVAKGKRQFLNYVPRAWQLLREWLTGPCRGRYPRLQRTVMQTDAGGLLKTKVISSGGSFA